VVATALDDLGISCKIKWPNDLLVAGRKVAGILIESWGAWTVTGIGVNVFWCPADAVLRLEGSVGATTLEEWGVRQSPLAVWLAILQRGRDELRRWLAAHEARDLCEAVEGRLAWLGDDVLVHESPEQPGAFECRILGLNADGSLRVRRQGRVTALQSGRLSSLRR
jgi:BirA family biotin operon repressor/biotin-[acetyl-CoA-carboxylase] ligase